MFSHKNNTAVISKKLILYIILFSSLITGLITIVQLYVEYRADKSELDARVEQISPGYRQSIVNAVWLDDKQQLLSVLRGIVALPNVEYARVTVNDDLYLESGYQVESNGMNVSFPLVYEYNNKLLDIGMTYVEADLSGLYYHVLQQAWAILGLNAIKTTIVALFMFFLFNQLVIKRLDKISRFIREYDINDLNRRIVLDITKPNQAEDEIVEIADGLNAMQEYLSDALLESQNLKKTLDVSVDGIFMFHPDTEKFFYTNSGATMLLGYSHDELMQMTPADICPDLTRSRLDKLERSSTEQNENALTLETDFKTIVGKSIPVILVLQYMQLEQNSSRFVFIARDITERKKILQAMRASLDEVKAASEAKSKFMMSMSHELRTPLNAIIGFTQLLQLDEQTLNKEQNDSVRDIATGGQSLLKLIEDLLDLGSIESSKMMLDIDDMDPLSLVKNCIDKAIPLAVMRDVNLVNNITETSLPKMSIDPARFQQTLNNLLSNAIKYNKTDGLVTLDCEILSDSIIRFKVTDTGKGISSEDQCKIFSRFDRLGLEAGNIEGVGIGLNISKDLIEMMGGKIDFESNLGQGSSFWIDLPYLPEEPSVENKKAGSN